MNSKLITSNYENKMSKLSIYDENLINIEKEIQE